MADTNAWRWVPSELIWQQLELPGSLVSTRLMNTCCLDAGFPEAFAFDRIMARCKTTASHGLLIDIHVE